MGGEILTDNEGRRKEKKRRKLPRDSSLVQGNGKASRGEEGETEESKGQIYNLTKRGLINRAL